MRKFLSTLLILFVTGVMSSCPDTVDEDTRAQYMQSFVKSISAYARSIKNDFIIIPQNGIELAFNNTDRADGLLTSYINAINGVGIEELFYNGTFKQDTEKLNMARELKNRVKVMVSDYVSRDTDLPDSVKRSEREGFISFQRSHDNYDYKYIPGNETITDVNENDIVTLQDAKNFLYLISAENYSGKGETGKEEMLDAIAATNYDVIFIDLFFDDTPFTKSDIARLQTKANGKKRLVISYVSIGSAENYRYYWKPGWKKGNPSWLKKNYEGYPDEFWVEYWNPEWKNIIYGSNNSYIKKIIDAGFDGAYLDNVEAYYFLD